MRLDYKQLAAYAPFLRMEKVQVGDVLLSRANEKSFETTLIALATLGTYSHAAVFIWLKQVSEARRPLVQLIEAEDQGVGWTNLSEFPLAIDGTTFETVAALPGIPSKAALLRHPEMSKVSAELLVNASNQLHDEQLFMAYPPLTRLVEATPFPSFIKGLLRRVVAHEEKQHDPLAIGSFCSQLVAQFFELLPIQLFTPSKLPQEVSPNDLARSNLIEVPNALILKDMIGSTAIAEIRKPDDVVQSDITRKSWLPYVTGFKAFTKLAGQTLPVLVENFRERRARQVSTFYLENRRRIKGELRDFPKTIDNVYRASDTSSDPDRRARVDELNNTLLYLICMDRVLDREDEKVADDHRRSVRLQFMLLQNLMLTELNYETTEFWKEMVLSEQPSGALQASLEEYNRQLPEILQNLKRISAEIPNSIAEMGVEAEIAELTEETNREYWRLSTQCSPNEMAPGTRGFPSKVMEQRSRKFSTARGGASRVRSERGDPIVCRFAAAQNPA